MKKVVITIATIVLWLTAWGQNNSCQELFISEMIEANAPNRALELFNPSDVAINLSDYKVRLFQNGQLTPLDIPLSGTLPPKSTFVIAHQAAKPEIKSKADMLDPQLAFDGNDAIVLEKTGGTQVDKIGEVGVNPGNSGWNVPPNGSTREQTLRRKPHIDKGETDWNQAKNQWSVHPKEAVDNLKQHEHLCNAIMMIGDAEFFSSGLDSLSGDSIMAPDGAELKIYPNPNSGQITFEVMLEKATNGTVSLQRIDGRTIFTRSVSDIEEYYSQQLDLSEYGKGMYYLKLVSSDGDIIRKVIYQ